jgi:general secretion pathway protein G
MVNTKGLKMNRRRSGRAFTLIELLLVLVILAVLAAVVVPKFTGRAEDAKRKGTIADIAGLKTALNTFEADNSRYPNSEEGLQALVSAPPDLKDTWKGPYVEKVPTDKWGNPYIYRFPGLDEPNSYDLLSVGTDKQENTADDITKFTEK